MVDAAIIAKSGELFRGSLNTPHQIRDEQPSLRKEKTEPKEKNKSKLFGYEFKKLLNDKTNK